MKYRQYKIVKFIETEDKQFGRAWLIQAKTTGLDPSNDADIMLTDLYSSGKFTDFFIAPYDNEVVDELEGIAQCNELWSPDTDDWTVDKENTIVDGIPITTHHYCGKMQEKLIKATKGYFRVVSWMPLCQFIEAENAPFEVMLDSETERKYFVCGTVKGNISTTARKAYGYEASDVKDFKVAMVSKQMGKEQPWLLLARNPRTLIVDSFEHRQMENLLEMGQWRQAFPYARWSMQQSLTKMNESIIDTFDMFEKNKDSDPEINPLAGAWFNRFTDINAGFFLPAIKDLLQLFDLAIKDIDGTGVWQYEDELGEIKQIVDYMYHDAQELF